MFCRRADYIIIGSDSGRIVVLEYDPETNGFNKLHQETYGRSGSRRIVPGQHIATDPKGRAVMIGAMEKSKLVYILNRVRHLACKACVEGARELTRLVRRMLPPT